MERKQTHRVIPASGDQIYPGVACDTVSPREYAIGSRNPKFVDCQDCIDQTDGEQS